MPNHVLNFVQFKKLQLDEIEFILNTITTKDGEDYHMDFNKIIPQPRFEAECPEDCKVNKYSRVEIQEDKPWFDWYAWNTTYWYTKWGAYSCYSIIGKSYITLVFQTAWSFALPICYKLQLLGFDFTWKYADEDYGSNCGIMKYEHNTGAFTHYDESELKDSKRFARELWKKY